MTILSSVASALDTWRMIRCPGKIAEKKWPFVLLSIMEGIHGDR